MTTSRVHEIKLRLRMSEVDEPRASALRELVEQQLLRGVLESFDEAVRARLGPHAIVRIRRLPLRWRLEGHELAEPAVHRRLGEELAEGVLEAAGARTAIPAWPAPDAIYAVFSDQAHAIAVAIAERVEGRAAFHHPAATTEELWQLAASGATETGGSMVLAVICRLVMLEVPLKAVASIPPSVALHVAEEVQAVVGVPAAWSRVIAESATRAASFTARAAAGTRATGSDAVVERPASGDHPGTPDEIDHGDALKTSSRPQDAVIRALEVRVEDIPHALRTGSLGFGGGCASTTSPAPAMCCDSFPR